MIGMMDPEPVNFWNENPGTVGLDVALAHLQVIVSPILRLDWGLNMKLYGPI